jgi:dGTP triphosphohydrolase
LVRDAVVVKEMAILKQLTWHYVIEDPALVERQYGQCYAVGMLFKIYMNASDAEWERIVPAPFTQLVHEEKRDSAKARLVIDMLASMGEHELLRRFQTLTGNSMMDLV